MSRKKQTNAYFASPMFLAKDEESVLESLGFLKLVGSFCAGWMSISNIAPKTLILREVGLSHVFDDEVAGAEQRSCEVMALMVCKSTPCL